MTDDRMIFMDEENPPDLRGVRFPESWPVLIVDDDPDVHDATVFALKDSMILDRPLSFAHTYSGKETVDYLRRHPETVLVLLDAVMETEDAGLSIIRILREEMGLESLRIILRTGQPGQIPELETIMRYDINDYKTKSELTRTKLVTTIVAAIRAWQQLQKLENSRRGLQKIVEASNQFITETGLQRFAEGVITQMAGLLGLEPDGMVCVSGLAAGGFPHLKEREPANPPCTDSSGYCIIAAAGQYRGMINRKVQEIENREISDSITRALREKKNQMGDGSLTVFLQEPSGRSYAIWIASPVPLKELDYHLLEIFCTNISLCASNIELVNRLKHQAWEDSFLKIPNLAALLEVMRMQLEGARSDCETLVLLDIDGFSQVNELLGHEYGDQILFALVGKLKETLEKDCFLARVSSDVFAVLGKDSVFREGLLSSLTSMVIQTAEGERELSLSLGITRLDPREGDASTHLRNGYIALKQAKGEGPGQISRYSQTAGIETRERIRLLHDLRGALTENKLFMMFQPQATLKDGRVYSLEALLRWRNREGLYIPPDRFIPLAEQAGLMVPLGSWILRMALQTLRNLHLGGYPEMMMAVNVSAVQLRHPDFLQILDEALEVSGIDPRFLELEITESISIMGIEDILERLHAIRERGITLSVDDFGTGYSSLSSIDRWPINRLKIDKTFIHQMDTREKGGRLVDLVIPLGKKLSLRILAEGVETESQYLRLKEMGCHEVQGYYLSKPLEYGDLIRWLESRREAE